jgi:hypothetical protein
MGYDNLRKLFPEHHQSGRKIFKKAALPGCLFIFDASLYSKHEKACEYNAVAVENAAVIVQGIRRVTAAKTVQSMKTDKGQFDEVLRRMLEKPPQKTSAIHAKKKEPKKMPSQGQK